MAKPRARQPLEKPAGEYHHGDLRRAILQAAAEILGEGGADAFTLREAARRIGVNHRALYRHFADRDAVLAAVAHEGYCQLLADTKRELAKVPVHDVRQRLLTFATAHVSFAMRDGARYRLMTGKRLNEAGRFPELELPIGEGMALLASELQAGIEAGTLLSNDIMEVSLALSAAIQGLATMILTRRIRVRPERMRDFTERAVGHTVRGLMRNP